MDTSQQSGSDGNGKQLSDEQRKELLIDEQTAARLAAEKRREALAEQTITDLMEYLQRALLEHSDGPRIDTKYGALYDIGMISGAIVLACEDGRAFNVSVNYDSFVGQTRWQRIAVGKARSLGHEPGEWEYAASFGYISVCEHCGGMMAAGMDKRPHGEQFDRICPETNAQLALAYGYIAAEDDD